MRRNKIEIVNDILVSIQDKNGKIKPTHLLYKSNLSYKKMKEYIDELIKKEMMKEKEVDENRYYFITDKGLKFISEFRKMKEFTESFGL